MVTVETQGMQLVVEDDRLDDWEFLELLREYDKGNSGLIVDIMESILGAEQYNKLKAHLKERDGRVSSKTMISVFSDVMNGASATKN